MRLPVQMQRAMATEAEAAREARAKVIAAEGEQKASVALKEAADVITQSPVALQLRYLQTPARPACVLVRQQPLPTARVEEPGVVVTPMQLWEVHLAL